MRLSFVFVLIAASAVGCCFSKKRTENRITKANSVWLPDSCYVQYALASNTFDTAFLKLTNPLKGYALHLETQKCAETLTESQKIDFASTQNIHIAIEHESSDNTEGLNIWVDKVKVRYDFDQKLWIASVTNEGRVFENSGDILDSLEVSGKMYKPVLHAVISNVGVLENAEAREIWFAPHFGIIQIETLGGTSYQRLRN